MIIRDERFNAKLDFNQHVTVAIFREYPFHAFFI
jgi:hypothetical protein